MTRLAMVAGEASGDLLASLLMKGLGTHVPNAQCFGVGGRLMEAGGFRVDVPLDRLAVRGYAEVIGRLPELLALRRRLGNAWLKDPPDAFIGVDAPDFNLALETRLKAKGIPTVHFVSPSIWAWRAERIEKIRRAVTHMLVVFPFEASLYQDHGIDATYVGHPLAGVIPMVPDRDGARALLGLAADRPVVALLPGSRMAELHHMAEPFLRAAAELDARHPGIQFVVPLASQSGVDAFDAVRRRFPGRPASLVTSLYGSHSALAASDCALVASGTATLEAALYKRPMVIAYKMPALSWWIMRNKGYQPWVGLPNILARRFVVPEFLQDAATPAALADALEYQLTDAANREAVNQEFTAMHDALLRDTADLAGRAIANVVRH